MSGFAPPKSCPSTRKLTPLPQSWDIATEVRALHRHVAELTECIDNLQQQLAALQAPERPTKRPPPEPK